MIRTSTMEEIENRIAQLEQQYQNVTKQLENMLTTHPAWAVLVRDKNKISTELYLERKKRNFRISAKPANGYGDGAQPTPKQLKHG